MNFIEIHNMTDSCLKKCGFIDVKQPAKTRGRKMKPWKRRWLVVHTVPNRTAETYVTQIEIYPSYEAAKNKLDCKRIIILENLTSIKPVKSKTHKFAVEVIEREPVLLLAGETELETQKWIVAISQIFRAKRCNPFVLEVDVHRATILENKHTCRLGLGGEYEVHVSPEHISIHSLDSYNSYEWSLSTLKRFQLLAETNILVFECGHASESGEATIQFKSAAAQDILTAIRKNIFIAISVKQSIQNPGSPEEIEIQDKLRASSVANGEKIVRGMLENCSKSGKDPFRPLTQENGAHSTELRLSEISARKSTTKDLFINFDLSSINKGLCSVETLQSVDSHGVIKSILLETPTSSSPELPLRSEMADVSPSSSEYNTLDELVSKRASTPTNISEIPVTIDNNNLKFFMDDQGYSHVTIRANITPTDDKSRTLSNLSTASSVSFSTNSTGSRDSGIFVTATDSSILNTRTFQSEQKRNHRPSDSFDSVISTSSISEDPAQTLQVYIEQIKSCPTDDEAEDKDKDYGYSVLYQQKNNHHSIADCTNTSPEHRKPSLQKSNSTGNVVLEENIYEDVDKYRKNLEKFLGLDPKIDPTAIPPSLPERPPTLKPKRKLRNMSAHSRSLERKLFNLPRFSISKGKKKENSSSESDEESSDVRKGPSKVAVWPLGVKSVTDDNELYQRVAKVHEAIEARPIVRQRSNSLNVNVFSTRKQQSHEQRKIDCADLLTGDNLPVFLLSPVETKILRPEKFGPNSNSTPYDAKNGIHINWDRTQTLRTHGQDVSLFEDLLSPSEENLRNFLNVSEEPIYAEVKPRVSDDIPFEPPFPDIAHWYPHHGDNNSEIKDPKLSNPSDLPVLDFFHFGFNFPVTEKALTSKEQNKSSLSLSRILSQSNVFSEENRQNKGGSNAYLSALGVQDCICKITKHTELPDNVYADMSICTRDDVYVLPSDVVQVNN